MGLGRGTVAGGALRKKRGDRRNLSTAPHPPPTHTPRRILAAATTIGPPHRRPGGQPLDGLEVEPRDGRCTLLTPPRRPSDALHDRRPPKSPTGAPLSPIRPPPPPTEGRRRRVREGGGAAPVGRRSRWRTASAAPAPWHSPAGISPAEAAVSDGGGSGLTAWAPFGMNGNFTYTGTF